MQCLLSFNLLAPCSDPGRPHNGGRVGDNFEHGRSANFKCRAGFELKGDTTITCSDGTWNGSKPECKGKSHHTVSKIINSIQRRNDHEKQFTVTSILYVSRFTNFTSPALTLP